MLIKSNEKATSKLARFDGVAKKFEFDTNQKNIKSLGVNSIILRRSLWQKNIRIRSWKNERGQAVWIAQGANDSFKFVRCVPSLTSRKTKRIIDNKLETKVFLSKNGVKTPSGICIYPNELDKGKKFFSSLKSQAVVKPRNGSGGKGITANIDNEDSLIVALGLVDADKQAIIEEHIHGNDHRILVIGGSVVAAQIRHPAFIIGDGLHSVKELIDIKNEERIKNPYNGRYLLSINDESNELLKEKGLNESSIVAEGEKVELRTVANIGAGGDSEDVTSKVHPDFIDIAVKCWDAFGDLYYCGVDLIAEDISKPAKDQDYAVVEVNVNCDISIHHFPTIGQPLDVAKCLADYLFPSEPEFKKISRKIIIQGSVQRVGYRNWLHRNAMLLGITGYCKNVENRKIEVVVEGSPASIDEMKMLCLTGPLKSNPSSIKVYEIKDNYYSNFSIL